MFKYEKEKTEFLETFVDSVHFFFFFMALYCKEEEE